MGKADQEYFRDQIAGRMGNRINSPGGQKGYSEYLAGQPKARPATVNPAPAYTPQPARSIPTGDLKWSAGHSGQFGRSDTTPTGRGALFFIGITLLLGLSFYILMKTGSLLLGAGTFGALLWGALAAEKRWFGPDAVKRRRTYSVCVGTGNNDKTLQLKRGRSIRDAEFAPELVLVPPGKFTMGSDHEYRANQHPRHEVTISYPLLIGKYPVTFAEWDAYVEAGGSTYSPDDRGLGRGRRSVINVSWHDAKAYVAWLSKTTGKSYRLLSEAEWEYACRAGTMTRYSFGDDITAGQADLFDRPYTDGRKRLEVGSFAANAFGLHDMHGSVREWVEDAYHDNYIGAPNDGSAWRNGDGSARYVCRGGSWADRDDELTSADRQWDPPERREPYLGLRVARTLESLAKE